MVYRVHRRRATVVPERLANPVFFVKSTLLMYKQLYGFLDSETPVLAR